MDRIVVRQIGEFPYGSICQPNLYTLNTIYNIFLSTENVSLKYVLAIINSKITAFYWKKLFYDNKVTFPKIKKDSLESIRIPKLSPEFQEPLIDLVDKILSGKGRRRHTGLGR
ncbi:MAG: hypothetical protein IPO04_09940 [Cytophagaceae bacterium]|nr:hypothetical protein [Cytophagaceae bacterium]